MPAATPPDLLHQHELGLRERSPRRDGEAPRNPAPGSTTRTGPALAPHATIALTIASGVYVAPIGRRASAE